MKFPDNFRSKHPLHDFFGGFDHKAGDQFGWFVIPINGKLFYVMADGSHETWEHVSVSSERIPNWKEMCIVKDLFWNDNECVVQFHPPKDDYVNMAKNCLHLWRYKGEMPRPPSWMVGLK